MTRAFKWAWSMSLLKSSSSLFKLIAFSAIELQVRSQPFWNFKNLLTINAVRLGRLIGKNFKSEFGDTVMRIERKTKSVDDMAVALSQVRAAQFFAGKLTIISDEYSLIMD